MTKNKLDTINQKLDLVLEAISIIPLFVASVHQRNPRLEWDKAVIKFEKIEKQYTEIIKNENNNNSSGVKDKIS